MKSNKFVLSAIAWLIFFGFSFSACKKEETSLPVFREITAPAIGEFSATWFTDSLKGFIVGGKAWEKGFILSTADGGETWQTDTILNRKMESVMFDPQGQGYVCGQDFALFRPSGNPHWYDFRINYQWNKSCYFPDNQRGIIVTGGGYQSGQIFTFGSDAFWRLDTVQDFPNALADVWFSDSATAHAVGIGWVLRSADAGKSWQRYNVTGDFFQSVQFPTPRIGYVCGSSGTILKTQDAGLSWQNIREGGSGGKRNQPFRALWFVSAEKGCIVGDDGLFWITENGGASWARVKDAPSDANFTDVFAFQYRGWVVAKNGRVFYFEW